MQMGKPPRLLSMFLFLLATHCVVAQSVSIISPRAQGNVTSPVRVVAEFPKTAVISSITVSVDNLEVQDAGAVTPLDVQIPVAEGSHLITVNSVAADGTVGTSSRWVNVEPKQTGANTFSNANTNVYNQIEEMAGWYNSPDQGHPVCSSGPTIVSSPSLDGAAGMFYLGPTGQYNNCLWPIKLGSGTVSNFELDTYYQLSDPSYSQGVEFSSNHHVGTKWYKFSVQCSYNKGIWSVWDTAGGKWSATTIPCKVPKANAWDHLIVETSISGGKAVFSSLTLNGVQYSINQSFSPLTKADASGYGVHFQMNGDLAGHAYYAYVDEMKFTAW